MHSGRKTAHAGLLGSWAARLLWFLAALACEAQAGDIVRLRGGREVEGTILAITAEVITLQVEQGILRLPRDQVLSIHMEQTQVVVPEPPPAAGEAPEPPPEQPGTERGRDPEPGEEGWKPPAPPLETGETAPAATSKTLTAPKAPSPPAPAPAAREADDRIHSLLSRYLWLVPEDPSHRISLGAGILFLATLIVFLAGKLADVEGATFPRSFFLAGCLIGLGLLQVTLCSQSGWPILFAVGAADLLFWFGMTRFFLGAPFWKGTVMLASAFFAVVLGVLWLEVMGYLLNL